MKKLLVVIGVILLALGITSCTYEIKYITWGGFDDKTIKVGDTFDPLEGLSATFNYEPITDLTEHIEVSENQVNTNVPGEYTVRYKIAKENMPVLIDADGNEATFKVDFENSRKITVVSNLNESPVINGAEDQQILMGDSFDARENITATDFEDGDLTKALIITGSVDTNTAGDYEVQYIVTDSDGNETTAEITITIYTDTFPVIEGIENQSIFVGETYDLMTGVSATDLEDGDLTSEIEISDSIDINIIDNYTVTYSVEDSDGNVTIEEIIFTVKNNTDPVINNVNDFTVYQGDETDFINQVQMVNATDEEDGDITSSLKFSGFVDLDTPGDYIVIVSITDSDGNYVEDVATITVIADNAPLISGLENLTINVGESYDLITGVNATDDRDGDLTSSIQVNDPTDVNTVGDYTVTFTVNDSYGNTTTETIVITVVDDSIDLSTISNVILRVTMGDDPFGEYPYDSLTGGFFADTNSVNNVDSSNKITEDLIYYEAVIWVESGVVSLYQFTNEYNPNYEYLPDVTPEMAFAYREQFLVMNFENMPRIIYDEVANEMVAIDFPESDPWNGFDYYPDQASTFLLNAFSAFTNYLVTTHPSASHNLLYYGDDSYGGDLFNYNMHSDDADQFLNNWTTSLGSNLGFIEMSGEMNNKASVIDLVVFGPYTDYYIATDIYGTEYTFDDCNTNNCESVDWDLTNVEYQYFNIFSQGITFQAMLEDRIDVTMYRYNISVNDLTASQNYQALYLYDTQAFLTFYNNLNSFLTDKDIFLDEDLVYFLEQNGASQLLIDEYYSTILYEASTKTYFTWMDGYSGMILNFNIQTFTAPSE